MMSKPFLIGVGSGMIIAGLTDNWWDWALVFGGVLIIIRTLGKDSDG
jgi:hypothetical protein